MLMTEEENREHIPINDGAHIIYVNGAKEGSGTALEKVARYSGLSLEKVKELAPKKSA